MPSLESLITEAEGPTNKTLAMNGEGKLDVRHWDKNSNEFLLGTTKEETVLQPARADGVKEQIEKLNLQRTKNNSPKVMHTALNTGIHDSID